MKEIQQQKLLEAAIGSLRANHDELSTLVEILYDEGFGGREYEITNEEQARELAEERLAWLRQARREGVR